MYIDGGWEAMWKKGGITQQRSGKTGAQVAPPICSSVCNYIKYITYLTFTRNYIVLYFSYLTWTQSQCWKVISPEDRPSLRLQRQSSGRSGSMLERQRCKLNYSYGANTFRLLNLLPVKFHVFQNLGGYLRWRNLCVTCFMMAHIRHMILLSISPLPFWQEHLD